MYDLDSTTALPHRHTVRTAHLTIKMNVTVIEVTRGNCHMNKTKEKCRSQIKTASAITAPKLMLLHNISN